MLRRVFACGLAMLGAVGMLFGAAAAPAAGTLRIGMQDDPDQLDPAVGGTFAGRIVFAAMCDKLVDLTDKLSFAPQLATAWSWSADNRALTLTLRDGVTFQDGEKLDAQAVAANLERYRGAADSNRKPELRSVSAIEVVDARTVRIVLSQPYAPLVAALADRAGMMASPKAVAALGKDFAGAPVCSGPFRLTERVAQDHMTLDRYGGYWNSAAIHFDRVVFRPIANTSLRLVNLQSGQLDIIEEMAATDAARVKADPKLRLVTAPGLGFIALTFNLHNGARADNPVARDPRVRAALEAAIDRTVINQVVMEGLATVNNQTELPSSPYNNKAIPVPARDVEHARALLKEAGVANPEFEVMAANTPRDAQIAEVIQSMAADAGFRIKVTVGEVNSNIAAMTRGDYQSHVNVWSGRADPDPNLWVYLGGDSFQNWGKYDSKPFNDLLAQARAITDPGQRAAVYHKVADVLNADKPFLVLFNLPGIFGHSAGLKGFHPVPDGLIRVQDLTLE
jgi:peptide/nickel transport system substrate-binding protein